MKGTLLGDLSELVRVYRGGETRAETPRATAAVVLGTQVLAGGRPSRPLRARALHGALLYLEGFVKLVIPTGGVGKHPPSEAAVASKVLRDAGVPDEAILREGQARNTWESARLVAQLVRARGIEDVLCVTDPLHCVRTVSAFGEAGLSARAAPVYDSPMWRSPYLRRGQFLREIAAIIWYRARSHFQR